MLGAYQGVLGYTKEVHEGNISRVADGLLLIPLLLCIEPLSTCTAQGHYHVKPSKSGLFATWADRNCKVGVFIEKK